MYILIFAILLNLINNLSSEKILGVVPTPFYSHQSVFQSLWKELSIRGHQVTLITTNPIKNTSLTNLKEIDLSFTYKLVFDDLKMQEVINKESNILHLMRYAYIGMTNMTEEQLWHPEIQQLIASDYNFDLVICEVHVPSWFAFAKKYNCPLIGLTSMPTINFLKKIFGNMNNPIYTHSFNLPFGGNLNLWERLVALLFEIFEDFYNLYFVYPTQENLIHQALNDSEINLLEITKKASLLLSNGIFGFDKTATHIPSIIELNGLQIRPPKALPPELQKFLDNAFQGLIFFSLGSNVKSYLISEEKQKMLLEVFSNLPYKVLWKFEISVDSLPPNVKMIKWVSQQDILRHNNTRLFITQGGLQSLDEAIRFRIPILGFPFFGDQFYNLKRVEVLKLGSWCDFQSLTSDLFKSKILETIDNQTYLENLEEMRNIQDYPPNSLDKAVWWIEYVLRHKGATNLRSPLADIPFYQYYLLDVGMFIILISVLFSFASLMLLKLAKKNHKY